MSKPSLGQGQEFPGQESPGQPSKSGSAPETASDVRFEIKIAGALTDDQPRVLKQGDTFALFDRYGDINPLGLKGEAGMYHDGTRYLSRLVLTVNGDHPLLLNSAVDEENVVLTTDLTNPDFQLEGQLDARHGALHIQRSKVLYDGSCLESIQVTNYADKAISCTLLMHVGADFADLFEIRGTTREKRGTILPSETSADGLILRYQGLDGVLRSTFIDSDPMPDQVEPAFIGFRVRVEPHDSQSFLLRIGCEKRPPSRITLVKAREELAAGIHEIGGNACRIETSNQQFNSWLGRSYSDLFMMITKTQHGLYPYAGVPWYSTVFGRDGIIAALECLWLLPELARGVLRFLAAHQAETEEPMRDAEPGKILHEMRRGEMAALDEIPFGRYYGSIDSTPLFIFLASAYYVRTGDRLLMKQLWPHISRGLEWIAKHGDLDGDGFIEYRRRRDDGLLHQGWKDSHDSVFHADGTPAELPIAVCEVQAYVYAAYLGAARIAEDLGRKEQAQELVKKALQLRQNFQEKFWMEDMGTFALALDGRKQQCRVRTSNAGQCLFSAIAEPWQAERVARSLLDPPHFSGWGIRTVDSREKRYNPMSYHNGSIWPHDNALIAAGFARYGLQDAVNHVFGAMFDVSVFMDLNRLPELFCGFARRRAQGPTLYPVACSPQVWAAGAVFYLLQACLAMRIDSLNNRIVFDRPVLPGFLHQVRLYGLRVGDTVLDLRLDRSQEDVGFHVMRKNGDAEVAVLK